MQYCHYLSIFDFMHYVMVSNWMSLLVCGVWCACEWVVVVAHSLSVAAPGGCRKGTDLSRSLRCRRSVLLSCCQLVSLRRCRCGVVSFSEHLLLAGGCLGLAWGLLGACLSVCLLVCLLVRSSVCLSATCLSILLCVVWLSGCSLVRSHDMWFVTERDVGIGAALLFLCGVKRVRPLICGRLRRVVTSMDCGRSLHSYLLQVRPSKVGKVHTTTNISIGVIAINF